MTGPRITCIAVLVTAAVWLSGCAPTVQPAVFYDAQHRPMKGQFDLDNCRNAAELYRPDMEALERKWAAGAATTVEAATFFRKMASTLDCMAARGYPFMQGVPTLRR